MNRKNPIINDGGQADVIKELAAVSPDIGITELPQALIVKSVYLGDLAALMIASDQRHSIRIAHLQRE
jgi:hypothetical protein